MSKGTGGEGTSKVPKTLPPQSGAKGKSPTAKTARLIHAPLSFVLTVSSPISFSCPLNVTLNKPACCSVSRRTARKVRNGSFPGWSGCLGLWSRGTLEKAYLNREQALPTVLKARGSSTPSREYAGSVSRWNGDVEGEDSL